jgi:hypothetical protein
MLFPNVAMPHVLWEYQGDQRLSVTERVDPLSGDKVETRRLVMDRPGRMSGVEYDQYLGDLVNFLSYMSEPSQAVAQAVGHPRALLPRGILRPRAAPQEGILERRPLKDAPTGNGVNKVNTGVAPSGTGLKK